MIAKWSEVKNDEYIGYYNEFGGVTIITKEDYNKCDPKDLKTYYTTIKEVAVFNWKDVVENLADEMYEDWEDVINESFKNNLSIQEIEKTINQILQDNPTYFLDKVIDFNL